METAVIGVPHPDFGEAVVAIVVPSPVSEPSETDIKDATKISLAGYKRSQRVFFAVDILAGLFFSRVCDRERSEKGSERSCFGCSISLIHTLHSQPFESLVYITP